MINPWNLGSFTPQTTDPKERAFTLRRYPLLRTPEDVLPKPLEIFADAEKYTSFRGMKDTFTILTAYGFLKTVQRTSFVDRLPIFGNVSLIMKRVTASCIPWLAEETVEKAGTNGSTTPTTRDFDGIFPILMDDLVAHVKEYGVPNDTLDWYKQVGSLFRLLLLLADGACYSRYSTMCSVGKPIEGSLF